MMDETLTRWDLDPFSRGEVSGVGMHGTVRAWPLLLAWTMVGCRFDFEIQPREAGNGDGDLSENLAGASSSGGERGENGDGDVGDGDGDISGDGGGDISGDGGGNGDGDGVIGTGGSDAGGGGSNLGGAPDPGTGGGPSDGGSASGGAGSGGAPGTGGSGPTCTSISGCECATYESKTYQFCTNPTDFSGAVFGCTVRALGLAELNSQAENDFFVEQAQAFGLFDAGATPYTSGSDLLGEGSWTWQSLTVFWSGGAAQVPFTNWQTPPMVDTNSNCLLINSDGTWVEGSCDTNRPFVCESL